jgi:hypothetical protein
MYAGYSWAGRGWFSDLTVGIARAKRLLALRSRLT